ncbi:MAG: MotA/TolQ/ExbB proton channel family protein, partial [Pseudomonadota bacterium]
CFLITDYAQERDGKIHYRGHGAYGGDAARGRYTMYWFDSMGSDPSALGPSMAVAMAGTLYGVGFARILLLPAATKIQQREEIIRFRNHLVVVGLALLADRKSPRYIQDKMNSYLDPSIHFNIDKMKT